MFALGASVPVREVNIAEYFDQALPLMRRNWAETGMGFEFAPARENYERAQALGLVVALGAFVGEELVGYTSGVLTGHPFNPEVLVCSTDTLYVLPEHRGGMHAGRLILTMERIARERGARYVFWHVRAGTPIAQVMDDHGYADIDVVKGKEL